MSAHPRLMNLAEGSIDARGGRRKSRTAPAHRQARSPPPNPIRRRSARRGRRKPSTPGAASANSVQRFRSGVVDPNQFALIEEWDEAQYEGMKVTR